MNLESTIRAFNCRFQDELSTSSPWKAVLGVIFSGVRATKWALVGVSLLSAADVAAFDFFCAEFGQGQKTIRFACLSLKAVIFTALKSLRRSSANTRNHWQDSLRNPDENHTRRPSRRQQGIGQPEATTTLPPGRAAFQRFQPNGLADRQDLGSWGPTRLPPPII
jgi:hypothetical protein